MPDPCEIETLRRLHMREACVLRQRITLLDLQRVGLLEKLAAKQAQLAAIHGPDRNKPPTSAE